MTAVLLGVPNLGNCRCWLLVQGKHQTRCCYETGCSPVHVISFFFFFFFVPVHMHISPACRLRVYHIDVRTLALTQRGSCAHIHANASTRTGMAFDVVKPTDKLQRSLTHNTPASGTTAPPTTLATRTRTTLSLCHSTQYNMGGYNRLSCQSNDPPIWQRLFLAKG